jgi:hypothetical protein
MSSGLMKSIEGNPLTADVENWTIDELVLGYDVESDVGESGIGFLLQSAVSFEFLADSKKKRVFTNLF